VRTSLIVFLFLPRVVTSLAYGGKILLRESKLRLLRGRRYALVGQNGVGKTTLMSAINNGKLEGWPQHLKTAYVDSGSNVDPAYEAQNVMKHLIKDTGRSEDECVAKMKELDFTDQMMKGTIGELSGGWQMKLRLIRAILMDPDIFLLDEPVSSISSYLVMHHILLHLRTWRLTLSCLLLLLFRLITWPKALSSG
jgi:elongation factor 3